MIQEKTTSKTKAILAVHLYGQLPEIDKINEIVIQNNLIVVEDAPQSQAFSFYPEKNLVALGEGVAIIIEKIHNEVLSLPISPIITTDEVDFVIQKLNLWTS